MPENERHEDVVDPDVDLGDPAQRDETRSRQWDILAVIAAGGVLGAWARYGIGVAVPHPPGAFPWSTVVVNASGCLLLGALMVVLLDVLTAHRYVRPFLGVGVLGGYTTFSTFSVEAVSLAHEHRALVALGYVLATVSLCASAMWVATLLTRRVFAVGRS